MISFKSLRLIKRCPLLQLEKGVLIWILDKYVFWTVFNGIGHFWLIANRLLLQTIDSNLFLVTAIAGQTDVLRRPTVPIP